MGFKDIELSSIEKEGVTAHFDNDSNWLKKIPLRFFEEKQLYYQKAGHFLHDFKFKTQKEQQIWQSHSEGVPMRSIAKRLEMRTCQVFLVIKRHRKKMLEKC